ncbi:HEAT repeat domain-containing protein [Streptacidiphilus sp. N1-3]|uniref:HEAT repeat domain-containing protein n=1 Tax=Streptacidiphilus alkalitolerans TaxID=3342712 RepID=A0ABV6XBL1_9ACTN
MSTLQLVLALSARDESERQAAVAGLAALGAAALPALVEQVRDAASPVTEAALLTALRGIGPQAFEPLLAVLRDAEPGRARRRAARFFTSLGTAALEGYVRVLADGDPVVRRAAVSGISACRDDALPTAKLLVRSLGDPDEEVRCAAVRAFCVWDEAVVPLLQAVRRDGPGAARGGALEALAEIGGEAVISARDIAALERLAQVALLDDAPVPIACCFLSWIAVSTGDQVGVLEELGLSALRQVPFTVGVNAADSDSHGGFDDDPLDRYRRVFVTPELAGWTLVVGSWCDPSAAQREGDVLDACVRLSARYGHAQAYWYGAQGDGSAVLIAEGGAVRRRLAYIPGEDTQQLELGTPLPYEQQRRTALGLPAPAAGRTDVDGGKDEDEDDEWGWELLELATGLAGELSLDPLSIDSRTPTRGTGLLALTEYGRRLGAPAGALRM